MTRNERDINAVLLALWRAPEAHAAGPDALAAATRLDAAHVQHALDTLAARGCAIVRNASGVSLERAGIPCWRDIIEADAAARKRRLGKHAMVFRRTASTSDIAWAAASDPGADGLTVLADEQTAGRGRRGSPWHARAGQSILLSVLLRDHADEPETLTLAAGLACAEAIETITGVDTQIKWPNDVHLSGRKTAGILVEKRDGHVVLGIGVNVAQSAGDFPDELRPHASSLYLATGRQFDRLRLVLALLECLEQRCTRARPADITAAWKARCAQLGQHLTLVSNGIRIAGRVVDIDPLQGLVLRDSTGALQFCSAATSTLSLA